MAATRSNKSAEKASKKASNAKSSVAKATQVDELAALRAKESKQAASAKARKDAVAAKARQDAEAAEAQRQRQLEATRLRQEAEERERAERAAAEAAEQALLDAAKAKADEEREKAAFVDNEKRASKTPAPSSTASSTHVSPDDAQEDINMTLRDLNAGNVSADPPTDSQPVADDVRSVTDSPVKKKRTKSKSGNGGKKASSKSTAKPSKSNSTMSSSTSTGKRDRNSASALRSKSRGKSADPVGRKGNDYEFPKVIYDLSAVLPKGKEAFDSFISMVRQLFQNIQLVDKLAILHSVELDGASDETLDAPKELSSNLTEVQKFVEISGGPKAFQTKRDYNNKDANGNAKERAPYVWSNIIVSSDVDPQAIAGRVCHEWSRISGGVFRVKELQCLRTHTPWLCFFLYQYNDFATLITELTAILSKIRSCMTSAKLLTEEEIAREIPKFAIRPNTPRQPGLDPSCFDRNDNKLQAARKVLSIESDVRDEEFLNKLVEWGKRRDAFRRMGMWVHLSKPVDYDSASGDIKRLIKFATQSCNYNLTMSRISIDGIIDLHALVQIQTGRGRAVDITVGEALQQVVRVKEETAIAELHQAGPMLPVTVVYPNTPQFERRIEMMAKHIGGFIQQYLEWHDQDEYLISQLLQQVDPELRSTADECSWDDEAGTLTTPDDLKQDECVEAFQGMSFFSDIVAQKAAADKASQPGAKDTYAKAKTMFQLDGAKSVKTIHGKNDGNYDDDSANGETIDLAAGKTTKAGNPPGKKHGANDNSSSSSSSSSSFGDENEGEASDDAMSEGEGSKASAASSLLSEGGGSG